MRIGGLVVILVHLVVGSLVAAGSGPVDRSGLAGRRVLGGRRIELRRADGVARRGRGGWLQAVVRVVAVAGWTFVLLSVDPQVRRAAAGRARVP